ncbi:hypothetical protein [Clostridium sp.]|nr:hypothetical protein [uncultured Clostridium sp.]
MVGMTLTHCINACCCMHGCCMHMCSCCMHGHHLATMVMNCCH